MVRSKHQFWTIVYVWLALASSALLFPFSTMTQGMNRVITDPSRLENVVDIALHNENVLVLNERTQPAINVYDFHGKYVRGIELQSLNTKNTNPPQYRQLEVIDSKLVVLNKKFLEVYDLRGNALWDMTFSLYPSDIISHQDSVNIIGLSGHNAIHTLSMKGGPIRSFGKYPVSDADIPIRKIPLVAAIDKDDIIISDLSSFSLLRLHQNEFRDYFHMKDISFHSPLIMTLEGRGQYYARPSGINGIAITDNYVVFSTYTVSPESNPEYYLIVVSRRNHSLLSMRRVDMLLMVRDVTKGDSVYLIGGDDTIFTLKLP